MRTKFLSLGVQPPSNLFVAPGQALQVSIYSLSIAQTIHVITRILRPDGEMREIDRPFAVAATLPPQTFTIPLTECFILSCTVISENAALYPSHMYAVVNLLNSVTPSAFVVQQLIGGYVSGSSGISYPNCPIRVSTDVLPLATSEIIADPGAGAPILFAVPAFLYLRLLSISFDLNTANAGVARNVSMSIIRLGVNVQTLSSPIAQPISTTMVYHFNASTTPRFFIGESYEVLQPDLCLSFNDVLSIVVIGMDPGDFFENIRLSYERRILA